MKALFRATVAIVLFLVAIAIGAWLLVAAPINQRGKQIEDLERLKVVRAAILEYQRDTGELPVSLDRVETRIAAPLRSRWAGIRDRWGREFVYASRNSSFVLVARGADGQLDTADPWLYRTSSDPLRVCGELDRDQVVSDSGWHRYCGK